MSGTKTKNTHLQFVGSMRSSSSSYLQDDQDLKKCEKMCDHHTSLHPELKFSGTLS